jgi:transposase-like protein
MAHNWSPEVKDEVIRRLVAGEFYLDIARSMGLREMTVRKYRKQLEASKPRQRVQWPSGQWSDRDRPRSMYEPPADRPEFTSEVKSVLAFSDAHDKPGRSKERFTWLGRFANRLRPDAIVVDGDTASLDSLSSHEIPGSAADLEKPSFHEELDSLDEALALFHLELTIGSIPIYHPHGNHEHRAVLAANRQPKQCGDLPVRLDEVFARYRWVTRTYGDPLTLFGVEFVHTIINKMGRPSNGEFPELIHGRKQVRDLVLAHTHTANTLTVPKNSERVKVVNLGCAMPYGERESYTPKTAPPWDYGAFVIRVKDGRILSAKHWDMLELEELFS